MLISLPLFGETHATGKPLSEDNQKRVEFLSKSLSSSKYLTNKATYLSWVKFFEEDGGRNSQFRIEALLVYWLSLFVFPSPLEDGLQNYVFPLAVLLRETDWRWCPCTWALYTRG